MTEASTPIPLWELTALPRPLAAFKEPISKGGEESSHPQCYSHSDAFVVPYRTKDVHCSCLPGGQQTDELQVRKDYSMNDSGCKVN